MLQQLQLPHQDAGDQYVINIKGRFGDDVEWMFDDNNELIVGINTQFGLKEFNDGKPKNNKLILLKFKN